MKNIIEQIANLITESPGMTGRPARDRHQSEMTLEVPLAANLKITVDFTFDVEIIDRGLSRPTPEDGADPAVEITNVRPQINDDNLTRFLIHWFETEASREVERMELESSHPQDPADLY